MKKNNCSKHIVPEYLTDLKKVSEDICNMPYDKVIELFGHMEKKLKIDAEKDHKGGRLKLWILLNHSFTNSHISSTHSSPFFASI